MDASMWIAKTYLELTQLNEAEGKLDYLRNIREFPKKNKWELEATFADFYVQVRNYEKAIEDCVTQQSNISLDEQSQLKSLLFKYESLFDGSLGKLKGAKASF